jgi:predicted dinucleotide-binding enzyme
MRIGMIGKGNVGSALGKGLIAAGHEVKYGHRDKSEPVEKAAEWAQVIILAVPYREASNVAKVIAPYVANKVVVDVTNALGPDGHLMVGFQTSGAEEWQRLLPKAKIAKAFNYVFAQNMTNGKVFGESLTAFIASDDSAAKKTVMELAEDLGFDPVDAGGLKASRYLEPMAMMIIDLGYSLKMGIGIGFKLIKG